MRKTSSFLVIAVLLALAAVAPASPRAGAAALAASQGIDLWGGPGAKGAGSPGCPVRHHRLRHQRRLGRRRRRLLGRAGSIVATAPFTIPANGVAALAAPAALAGKGAFAYNVRSDAAVSAWSETYNETSAGRYGVSLAAVLPSELLGPGDEATGGGADVSSSTEPGRARTNVGVVCASTSTQACRLEVAVFSAGSLVGLGHRRVDPGRRRPGLPRERSSRPRPASPPSRSACGSSPAPGSPTSSATTTRRATALAIPLAVKRGAFSTAPVIVSFTASPASGCAPLETTFAWQTTGATKVSITGVGNDLPANGLRQVDGERQRRLRPHRHVPHGPDRP